MLVTLSILLIAYYFSLPNQLFLSPTATVLEDKSGNLLGARIAADGQWRFPHSKKVPQKFEEAILQFEDEYFYKHPGFNPVSLIKATYRNIKARRIVSGGSTISMQVIRLSRKKPRTFIEKFKEIILSTRMELSYTKSEILAFYASNAPFGGNTVGLEAAAWRYYGVKAEMLSWSEAATLAVLPNQPSLIYPGKNQEKLQKKRDRLLFKLFNKKVIDSLTLTLALDEPLPQKPHALPNIAPHLLDRASSEGHTGEVIISTVNIALQEKVNAVVKQHYNHLKSNEIHNAAVLVLDVQSGNTLAYVGNTSDLGKEENGQEVDIITAKRSTGSLLKPFLYAAALDNGNILKGTLLPDIPTYIKGFAPSNFSKSFDGAVHANIALSRSLNIPAVHLLKDYGVEKFHFLLKKYGMTTLDNPPGYYGLALILGGSEATLWDMCGMYGNMARTLNNYFIYPEPNRYSNSDIFPPSYIKDNRKFTNENQTNAPLNAAAIWQTFQAMLEVYRPASESSWKLYSSSQKIAWKTGTSFGFRDGWAIGITSKYVVGVWVGNADGEGRPGLTGIKTAGPILFDVFDLLPTSKWFAQPKSDMELVSICKDSGHRAGKNCPNIGERYISKTGLKTASCPYHQLVHLDVSEQYRVSSNCEEISNMVHKSWFVLPPIEEYYYKKRHPAYKVIPPIRNDCQTINTHVAAMQIIYPKNNAKIYVPKELGGLPGKTVFQVAHRQNGMTIYWHIDNDYVGLTKGKHQLSLHPDEGIHVLTLVDEKGNTVQRKFKIISE